MGPPSHLRRRRARGLAVVAALAALGASTPAAERSYALRIPDGQPVSFEVEFLVPHPGTLGVRAEWSGSRVLAFRLYGPHGYEHRARRSGPSPQRFEVPVAERDAAQDGAWRLSIRALSGRDGGQGVLTLELPEPPGTVRRRELPPPPPPRPEPDPWMVPRSAPHGAGPTLVHLFETVERFRGAVVREDATTAPDVCRWQAGALRWVTGWRDRHATDGSMPTIATRRYLRRVVESVREVGEVRASDDPILAGPPPRNRMRQRAWQAVRQQRIEEIERELDRLADMLRGGHAPELERLEWPGRLLSCLAACERYFEQRVRLGEQDANNAEIARSQWDTILAAAEVLEAMAFLTALDDTASR